MKLLITIVLTCISFGQNKTDIHIIDNFDQIKSIKESNFYIAWTIPVSSEKNHYTNYSTSDNSRTINFEDLAGNSDETIILVSFENNGEEINSTNIMSPQEYYLFKKQKFYWLGEQSEKVSYQFAKNLLDQIESKKRIYPILNAHTYKDETLSFYKNEFKNQDDTKLKEGILFWIGQLGIEQAADYLMTILKSNERSKVKEKVVFALHINDTEKANKYLTDIVYNESYEEKIREKAIFWKSQRDGMTISEMLKLLNTVKTEKLQEKVIFGISQLDDKKKTEALFDIVEDNKYSNKIREKALFWFGQSDNVDIKRLKDLYDDSNDRKLKEKMIFSMSQKDGEESTNQLLKIAKDKKDDLKLREKAIFWLSQREKTNLKGIFVDLLETLETTKLKEKVIFAIHNSSIDGSGEMLYNIAIDKDEELKLREKAIFWLGQNESVNELKKLYLQVESIKLKEKLIFSFHQNDSKEATDFMVKLLKLPTTETKIKKKIIFWLGQSNSKSAKDAIADLID